MLQTIMDKINAAEKIDAALIVEILNIILTEIFAFIGDSEGWTE